jgi:hypothetical protein
MRQHFIDEFDLSGISNLLITTNLDESIRVSVNSLQIETLPWSGIYFNRIPIKVKSNKRFGYQFIGWSKNDSLISDNPILNVSLTEDIELKAIYEVDTLLTNKIIINEINYNSSSEFDVGDWLEIANLSDSSINISDWKFSDSNDNNSFLIPKNTIIFPGDKVVLAEDTLQLKERFPKLENIYGNFNFNISNEGELLRIFDNNQNIVDSVHYGINPPWPTEPNGSGYTLEFIDGRLENSDSENWQSSAILGGTPGEKNSVKVTDIKMATEEYLPKDYELFQNYPNPFNATTLIKYAVPFNSKEQNRKIKLILYDVLGREIKVIFEGNRSPGYYEMDFDANSISSGIYFLKLHSNTSFKIIKMVLIK